MSANSTITVRDATRDDLPAILDIYNEQVVGGVATFDVEPKTLDERADWLAAHNQPQHPVIVAEVDGRVLGWASLSPYHPRTAFRFTAEISTYVHQDARGLGIGKLLVATLVERGQAAGLRTIVALIEGSNAASIRMVEAYGFVAVGRLSEVGYKFDAWLDIVIMQRML